MGFTMMRFTLSCRSNSLHQRLFQQRYLSTRCREPLRILFCGSDKFSCTSLQALHGEHMRNRGFIERLDVMVLPPKWAGRGNKELREVPCKLSAEKLGLRIHQRSTFKGWELPEGINMIIAVSFGLFVPSRILRSAKYGGLNVHPSLLPDLRGPAPIHHALLHGDRWTGVSLQTLDDKAFDHGAVLAQTPEKGFPIPEDISLADLTKQLADVGANMLIKGLRDGLYIPPHRDVSSDGCQTALRHASKLTKTEARIDWEGSTLATATDPEVLLRRLKGVIQVFGAVWTEAIDEHGKRKRVIFKDVKAVWRPGGEVGDEARKKKYVMKVYSDGEEREAVVEKRDQRCLVQLGREVWMDVGRVTVQGSAERDAAIALKGFLSGKKKKD